MINPCAILLILEILGVWNSCVTLNGEFISEEF